MSETNNTPILIALDHGYGNVKTPNFIFPTGITAYDAEPAMAAERLFWAGRWYAIGDSHKEFIADKTADEDYLKLTMVAIAKELSLRGKTEASVWLAVGLPLTWYGEQKEPFARYLSQVRYLEYQYNGTYYSVEIAGVDVYAQGVAAVADRLKEFNGVNILCDIGNGTMNIMYINHGRPVSSQCFTEKYGTNQCMIASREAVMRTLHLKIPGITVDTILCNGWAENVDNAVTDALRQMSMTALPAAIDNLNDRDVLSDDDFDIADEFMNSL